MKKKGIPCWNFVSGEHSRQRCREKKTLFCHSCGEKEIRKYECLNPDCVATRQNDLGANRKSWSVVEEDPLVDFLQGAHQNLNLLGLNSTLVQKTNPPPMI